ncbi:MAG TPA: metalloregulator ArsR/SmtB family transcription factor [Methylomirabilota bacterium]|nr:metalloregulator ArsR/SmtB family transcription factor [Methylomirabilota bacterium]
MQRERAGFRRGREVMWHSGSPATVRATAELAKALAHPARIRLLAMLDGGELCACQLTAVLGLAPSTVSAHLAGLRRAGLIEEDKRGRWVYSRLTSEPVRATLARQLFSLAGDDPQLAEDRALIAELRRCGPEELCRVGRDLVALGLAAEPPAG